MGPFRGSVVADTIDVRFAFSGKVSSVFKRTGDPIKKGETIATLDKKILQTELDRQLKEYEKVRAEFELFGKKVTVNDDLTKLSRDSKQADLDRAVKDVELAKYKMDQSDLLSPVSGRIINSSGLRQGMYITPASSTIQIIDSESILFQFNISQDVISTFTSEVKVRIRISGLGKEYSGSTIPVANGNDGAFQVLVKIDDLSGLLPGMNGEVSI